MDTSPLSLSQAVAHSFDNRSELQQSDLCACFHCYARFAPSEVRLWAYSDHPDDEDPGALRDDSSPFLGSTAICPQCRYDSVIGSAAGYPLTDEFLHLLHDHWHQSQP
jgi:hypothetical protein